MSTILLWCTRALRERATLLSLSLMMTTMTATTMMMEIRTGAAFVRDSRRRRLLQVRHHRRRHHCHHYRPPDAARIQPATFCSRCGGVSANGIVAAAVT
jgi:hypothetical protein